VPIGAGRAIREAVGIASPSIGARANDVSATRHAAPSPRTFANGAGADFAVELDSLVAVEGLPGVAGGWVRYTYAMSIDCSPPSGCYAKSQRIDCFANCGGGALAQIQRVSLDMNDRVVAQTEPAFDTPGSCRLSAARKAPHCAISVRGTRFD
jgi:hypothetical protein